MVWLESRDGFLLDTNDLVRISYFALLSWVIFHGHRFGKDCWLCEYRGLAISVFVVSWGIWDIYEVNEED